MRVLGILSGTSIDAIDMAVADLTADEETLTMTLHWHGEYPGDPEPRHRILGVIPPATSDAGMWARLDTEVGQEFGRAARRAIAQAGPVDLIASHGQTLYHWVEEGEVKGTLQIGNPAWIHAATAAPVISDFRSADVAAGGQGAPLASTLDLLWLGERPTAGLNLGGIANITIVGSGEAVTGDTGPANCLIDAAARRLLGRRRDEGGQVARSGRINADALEVLLADPFYRRPMPKSTGTEYFHAEYVRERLGPRHLEGPDLFATLTELTARTASEAINAFALERVVASGGGTRNPFLLERLRVHLEAPLMLTDDLGLPADAKEAYLFALLGYLSARGQPGVVPGRAGRTATGAERASILGVGTPVATERPAARARRVRVQKENAQW